MFSWKFDLIYLGFFDFFCGLGEGDRDDPDDELARFFSFFFSLSDSESDDELDEPDPDDEDDAELDSLDGERLRVGFSFTGDAAGLFALLLLFDDGFFGGEGDGDRRLGTGRFAGDAAAFSSSEEDEDDGLTLIRFGRFFSRRSSGDFFRAAFAGDGDRDEDEARALPFGSTGFFFFSSTDEDDDDEGEGERFFTGLTGLRRRSGVGERRRVDADAFDLS